MATRKDPADEFFYVDVQQTVSYKVNKTKLIKAVLTHVQEELKQNAQYGLEEGSMYWDEFPFADYIEEEEA